VSGIETQDGATVEPLHDRPPTEAFHWKRLLRGFVLFVVLTAVAFWILSQRGVLGERGLEPLRTVAPLVLIVGCVQALLDQVFGGLRIWCCARALGVRMRLWPCILANCANVFLGGVTPSQHAGGPAQIWILVRNGMRFTAATVTSFCTYLGTVTFFLALAGVLTVVRGMYPVSGAVGALTGSAAVLFAGTLLVGAVALPRPDVVIAAMRAVLSRLPRFGPRLVASAGVRGLEQLLRDYSIMMKTALRTGKWLFAAVVVLSTLIYVNKFFVAYVVARGLALSPSPLEVLHLQAVQSLVTYFVPTPGASGVAEVTAAELMGGVVPKDKMGAFIVLWRTMSLYLGMALGAAALLWSGLAAVRGRSAEPRARSF
jgi:uncharacterized protein (TIRG00374 family)